MRTPLSADRKRKPVLLLGLALILTLLGTATATAITWGEADDADPPQYPNVGAFMLELDDGRVVAFCTGTLVHPQLFLTAAHCTDYVGELIADGRVTAVYVSFDSDVKEGSDPQLLEVTAMVTHPDYADFEDPSNPYDAGALVLTAPVSDIAPAQLPPEGFLDELKRSGALRSGSEGAKFVVAGYGGILDWYREPPEIVYQDERRYAESEYKALVPAQLHMFQNRLHDTGGTCFGDSGGPAFWIQPDGTQVLVGITSWGDAQCVATGFDYRVDIPETLSFIDAVIDTYLP